MPLPTPTSLKSCRLTPFYSNSKSNFLDANNTASWICICVFDAKKVASKTLVKHHVLLKFFILVKLKKYGLETQTQSFYGTIVLFVLI